VQIVRRPLAPGETNHELLWLSVSSGGAGPGGNVARTEIAVADLLVFMRLPVHPCLTCGCGRDRPSHFSCAILRRVSNGTPRLRF